MDKIVSVILVLVGIINAYPLVGVLGKKQIESLYGIQCEDVSLQILMRHRAVLFGMLGLFMVYTAFRPALQQSALLAGLVSMLAFIALTVIAKGYNAKVKRVMIADIAASVLSFAALIMLRLIQ